MSGSEDIIEELRAELGRATGEQRCDLLVRLGVALNDRAMSAPGSGTDTDRAVAAQREALDALPDGDPRRAVVRFRLGTLHAVRYLRFEGPPSDRDTAISVLQFCVDTPEIGTERVAAAGAMLGVLLMFRAMGLSVPAGGGTPDAFDFVPMASNFEATEESVRDVERAVAVLGRFKDAEAVPEELRRMAASMHAVAALFGIVNSAGGEHGPDLGQVLGLLDDAGRQMSADDPGRNEVIGLHAFVSAGQDRIEGGITEETMELLDEATSLFDPGHMLHSALTLEHGMGVALRAQHGWSEEDMAEAPRLLQEAAENMAAGPHEHPLYEDGLRQLAGVLVSSEAFKPTPEGVARITMLAREVRKRRDPADADGTAKDTYLLGMAHSLQALLSGRQEDWSEAIGLLRASIERLSPDDPLMPTMLSTFGAMLSDRFTLRGDLADAGEAGAFLEVAGRVLDHVPAENDPFGRLTTLGLCGASRIALAWRRADGALFDQAVTELQTALDGLPETYPWRSRLLLEIGRAKLMRGTLRHDSRDLHEGITALRDAAELSAIDLGNMTALHAMGGLAYVIDGLFHSDTDTLRQGVCMLTDAVGSPTVLHGERARLLWALGGAHLALYESSGSAEQHDLAVARLEQARGRLAGDVGNPITAPMLMTLARLYRGRPGVTPDDAADLDAAIEAGLGSLEARTAEVLLQTGAEHGLVTARGAAEDALSVARWCLAGGRVADALRALEQGRGLVLHAATSAARVTELLREAGLDELAARWERADPSPAAPDRITRTPAGADAGGGTDAGSGIGVTMGQELLKLLEGGSASLGDLRQQVFDALSRTKTAAALVSVPGSAEIASALRVLRSDMLVHLVPGNGELPGMLLVLHADGDLAVVTADRLTVDPDGPAMAYASGHDEERLAEVCEWAWSAAIEPLLAHCRDRDRDQGRTGRTPRVVLVPGGMLGTVPWQAAVLRAGERPVRYACQEFVLSYAASSRQLMDIARRPRLPLGADPVFVAEFDADDGRALEDATTQTVVLRNVLYPDSLGLGRTGEREGAAVGGPEDVLEHVPGRAATGASLLQFCLHGVVGATPERSHLKLVNRAREAVELPVSDILRRSHGREANAPGGLVVLATCQSDLTGSDHDEALTLATAFLAAGAVGVVGSRWDISGRVTQLLMFMFHRAMLEDRLPPAEALRAAQLWMIDPEREIPPDMPSIIASDVRLLDLADPQGWGAFTHQGQ